MYGAHVVNAKKKNQTNPPTAGPAKAEAAQGIRLKPSTSDYATSAQVTADAMGLTGAPASKTKPNKLVLSLTGLAS